MVGIYKITSPSGKVYIGQSRDISKRIKRYEQEKRRINAIHSSIIKYGFGNHLFEIVHELPIDIIQQVLNDYEEFYIYQYRIAGIQMLNLREGGAYGGKMTQETRQKLSVSNSGKKMLLQTREALRVANTGRKMSESLMRKLIESRTGVNIGKMKGVNKGAVRTSEHREKIRATLLNKIDNKGEHHGSSKLKNEQVLQIRRKYIPFIYTTSMLASEYNISKTNVKDIISRKIWKHLW